MTAMTTEQPGFLKVNPARRGFFKLSFMRHALLWSVMALSVVALPGCGVFLVGSAVTTTAVVAADRRTVGEQVTDKEIDLKVANEMRVNFGQTARINATTYLGVVLLTGEVFSEDISKKANELAAAVPQVNKVINQLYVGPLASFGQIASDTWLSTKVNSTLLATQGIPSGTILVVVERDNVYLMGLVTQAEADITNRTVAKIGGVKEVFPYYQIMTPEQLRALQERNKINNELPPSNPTPSGMGNPNTVNNAGSASTSGSAGGSGGANSGATQATPIEPATSATPMPINPN